MCKNIQKKKTAWSFDSVGKIDLLVYYVSCKTSCGTTPAKNNYELLTLDFA